MSSQQISEAITNDISDAGDGGLYSNRSSPMSMPRHSLFDWPPEAQALASSNYMHRANSLIPKGRSILAKGGGLSSTPVQYTNSRSFKNMYKGTGSLSSNKLLQGLDKGDGLAKGHSILDSGRGLMGKSLFKMKHYNPLETIDDDIGGKEEKHDGGKTNGDDDSIPDSDSDDTEEDKLAAREARRRKAAKKGTNPATSTASTDLGSLFQLTPEGRQKQEEENLKQLQLQARADKANAKAHKEATAIAPRNCKDWNKRRNIQSIVRSKEAI